VSLAGKRIASYARFSTDKQSEQSCADQHAKVATYATRNGGTIAAHLTFDDAAISGAVRERPGLSMLMRAVSMGDVDVVIVEDLSRLSRDEEDLAGIRKRLAYADVRLIAVDGHDSAVEGSEIMGSVLGAFAAQYRRDIAKKTLRGMEGRARAGLATGGVAYGYRTVARAEGGFTIAIDDVRAAIVREIFVLYIEGRSPFDVASVLNERALPAPRGGTWQGSTVRMMLKNASYIGEWSFGTKQWRRDPETRARRPKKREGALVVTQRPELAIVDVATWRAASERFASAPTVYVGRQRVGAGRATYPLSGLLKCSSCGSLLTIAGGEPSRRYYKCSGARRGLVACSMREHIRESALTAGTVQIIRDAYAGSVERLREIIREEIDAANAEGDGRSVVRARLQRNEAKVRRLIDVLAEGGSAAIASAVRDLERQIADDRAELDRLAAVAPASLRVPSPEEVLAVLDTVLAGPAPAVREGLRKLLRNEEIRVSKAPNGGYAVEGEIDLFGEIAGARSASGLTREGLPFRGVVAVAA
jgi:site-specific DNA recombinase